MQATIRYERADPALLLDALVLPWSFLVLYGGDAGSGSLNTVSHITNPQTNGRAGTEESSKRVGMITAVHDIGWTLVTSSKGLSIRRAR